MKWIGNNPPPSRAAAPILFITPMQIPHLLKHSIQPEQPTRLPGVPQLSICQHSSSFSMPSVQPIPASTTVSRRKGYPMGFTSDSPPECFSTPTDPAQLIVRVTRQTFSSNRNELRKVRRAGSLGRLWRSRWMSRSRWKFLMDQRIWPRMRLLGNFVWVQERLMRAVESWRWRPPNSFRLVGKNCQDENRWYKILTYQYQLWRCPLNPSIHLLWYLILPYLPKVLQASQWRNLFQNPQANLAMGQQW